MTQQMQQLRMINARLSGRQKTKEDVARILYTDVRGDIFLENPLKETLNRLNGKIMSKKVAINSVVNSIPGYSIYIHRRISYIFPEELKAGLIDISLAEDGSSILDLETGEIVSK